MLVTKLIWVADVCFLDVLKTSELFILLVREETLSQCGPEGGAGTRCKEVGLLLI